jgi:basic membrane protein A
MRKLTLLMLTLMLAIGLAACGGDEEQASGSRDAGVDADAGSTPEEGGVKAGFIYVSPIGDAGWSYAHDLGRQAIEDMEGVTTSYVESVPEGADAARVIRNMARKDHDIVFTTSYGYMDPTINVAKDFPDTVFMHCSGFKRADNVGTYFGRIYQARYLTGLAAGAMTDANIIGYVAAFPIPEVIRGINAFTLGVREINPEAEVRVVWTKTWYDPATEKEAAKSLLDVGADVIAQHQDSPGPQEAAQEAGAYSIGYNSDMSAFAPKAHLTAAVWNWSVVYKHIVEQVQAGTWTSQDIWWGLDKGLVDIAPFGDMVPDAVVDKVLAAKEAIKQGKHEVFAGPIRNQKGEMAVPDGEIMPDGDLLGMTWFVDGVIGSTE